MRKFESGYRPRKKVKSRRIKKGKSNNKIYPIILIVIVVFGGHFFLKNIFSSEEVLSETSTQTVTETISIPTPTPTPVWPNNLYLSTLNFGDVFWGRRVNTWSQESDLKYAYPFSGLSTFERNKYDIWTANLECPVTNNIISEYEEETLLQFNCSPEYLSEARKWFDVFSLANNHTDNQNLLVGLNETRQHLEDNNFQYFGHYDNAVKDELCELLVFETRDDLGSNQFLVPIAFCGFHNIFKLPTEDQMDEITRYSDYVPTIVMPHHGEEYLYLSDPLKQSYFRRMVDKGADVILGGHPHSIQEVENYNDTFIAYSLGNFIFDQQFNDQVTQGIAIGIDFTFTYDDNLNQWQEFIEECKTFKDNCIQKAQSKNLEKIKFDMAFDLVATNNSGKLAKKGSDKDMQDMLRITKFDEVVKSL